MNDHLAEGKTFDPRAHLTKLPKRAKAADGSWKTTESDYLEVKWRLLWLRTEYPNAHLDTELVSHEGETAVFRARVGIPGGGHATGYGHESASDFGDYLEKAETKALGRALAALGYGTQFCEDFNFAEGGAGGEARVVDAPVAQVPPAGPEPSNVRRMSESRTVPASAATKPANGAVGSGPLATDPQIKAIYAIGRQTRGFDDSATDSECERLYGCVPQSLSRRQASEFIDRLRARPAETGA